MTLALVFASLALAVAARLGLGSSPRRRARRSGAILWRLRSVHAAMPRWRRALNFVVRAAHL